MRSNVEHEVIAINIIASVKDNGDGTWTSTAHLGPVAFGPITRTTRAQALRDAAKIASYDPSRLDAK